MTGIKDVTGTAFIVAEFRAEENTAPDPLYADPVVSLFLDGRTRAAAAAIAHNFPAAPANLRLRTRYFDDRLDGALARGCRQVVILGSGFDTRAVRKQAPGVVYFEIDHADTLSFKRARLEAAGLADTAVFIPGDYVASGALKLLDANGFRRDLPSFFLWEGNSMYLTRSAVVKVLTELADGVSRFSLAWDYMTEEVIAGTTGDQATTDFVNRFAAMSAPWRFGCNDLDALAREAGLAVVDVVSLAALHRALWPDQPADWVIDRHYFLCELGNGA
jgi:methyltransferase (TIGR00027 family)